MDKYKKKLIKINSKMPILKNNRKINIRKKFKWMILNFKFKKIYKIKIIKIFLITIIIK
jgi:hypothetical protein